MTRIAISFALILLGAVSALADSTTVKVTELGLFYEAAQTTVSWNIQAPLLNAGFGPHFGTHDFDGIGTSAVPQILCQAPCTYGDMFTFNLMVSGLQITNVVYQGVHYATVYFSGVLNLDARPFRLQQGVLGYGAPVHIFGTFIACSDSACKNQIFSMNINLFGGAAILLNRNQSGEFSVSSARYVAPEPTSLALFITGCVLIFVHTTDCQNLLSDPCICHQGEGGGCEHL